MPRSHTPPRQPPETRLAVGIDVGKDSHWVTAMTDTGEVVLDRRYASTPEAAEQLVAALRRQRDRFAPVIPADDAPAPRVCRWESRRRSYP